MKDFSLSNRLIRSAIRLVVVVCILNAVGCVDSKTDKSVDVGSDEIPQVEELPPGPLVFHTPFYQSPTRADPDDLLSIQGHGLSEESVVVYKSVKDDPLKDLEPPAIDFLSEAFTGNNSLRGVVEIVSMSNLPDSITVLLPKAMTKGIPYALWVKNPGTNWSDPVFINDARPLWVTPDRTYATKQFASLSRHLKVVGRNLEPLSSSYGTRIRLQGPQTYTLKAVNDLTPKTTIENYVAKVYLPSSMPVGEYTVFISRIDQRWIKVPSNKFTVLPDPQAKTRFDITSYGCVPNDAQDDTACITNTISAAQAAGGGEVFFPAGQWDLKNFNLSEGGEFHGIIVPQGVDLIGSSSQTTVIQRATTWKNWTTFTLLGKQMVRDITFKDADPTQVLWHPKAGMVRLGKLPPHVSTNDPRTVEDVIITGCKFESHFGIDDGGFPIKRVFIVKNTFQAYRDAIAFIGAKTPYTIPIFDVQDSVIRYNTFLPGDYINIQARQGTIAWEIGAGTRLDTSNNVANGRVNGGWRAGFFYHMEGNHEMELISENDITCSGDKAGDGEAIVFDMNRNRYAFKGARSVVAADETSVSVESEWVETAQGFYNGFWVQIADGKGVGQSRKIIDYQMGTVSKIEVSPAWDVIPDSTSRITIARVFWNTHIVDNVIDIRGCEKDNPTDHNSGEIGWYAMTLDSTIEGNQQFDTNGIYAAAGYIDETGMALSTRREPRVQFLFSNEIRNNLIDGEYAPASPATPYANYVSDSPPGGIRIWYATTPTANNPVMGTNLSISHNTIIDCDAGYKGAIEVRPSWYQSSEVPYMWKNILIFHNLIKDVPFYGIHIVQPFTWNTVIYDNIFENVEPEKQIKDEGTGTKVVTE